MADAMLWFFILGFGVPGVLVFWLCLFMACRAAWQEIRGR